MLIPLAIDPQPLKFPAPLKLWPNGAIQIYYCSYYYHWSLAHHLCMVA